LIGCSGQLTSLSLVSKTLLKISELSPELQVHLIFQSPATARSRTSLSTHH